MSQFIIHGRKSCYNVPEIPLGNYFLNLLKARNWHDAINIDPITTEVLRCGQLLENSVKLALAYKKLGLKKDDVITIISQNHIRYFEPVLAAFYLGISVNGLNPLYTANEFKHGLELTKPKIILCTINCLETVVTVSKQLSFIPKVLPMYERFKENGIYVESLEDFLEVPTNVEDFVPAEVDYYNNVAYILLSSGTTGLSKGVMLTHQNLINTIGYKCDPELVGICKKDVIILVPPFFHAYGVIMQLAAINASAPLIPIDKFKPEKFLQLIETYRPRKLFVVPPLLLLLAKSDLIKNYVLSSIEELWTGAAPAKKELIDEVCKKLGSSVVVKQTYGLTETSGPTTIQIDCSKVGSVGYVLPDAQIKIRDPKTHINLGSFQSGELCFKGPMVMKGYIGNEQATLDCMDEDGFLCTGDLGYYDDDGYVYIVDRLKELIKYKGFQVAPAELEALIVTNPNVQDCGVIGIPDEKAGQLPLAFVVPQNETDLTENDIINYVAERISVNKRLYGGVKFIDKIPKTPSGKIIRRELMEMYMKL